MALGFVGVDLADLEGWKARALQIVRRSQDPMRSMKLLRVRAASLFDFGHRRDVPKVNSMEEGCVPPRLSNKIDPLDGGQEGKVHPFDPDERDCVQSWSRVAPQQQRIPMPASQSFVVPDEIAVERDKQLQVIRPLGLSPAVFDFGAGAGQVDHLDVQIVRNQQPGCLCHEHRWTGRFGSHGAPVDVILEARDDIFQEGILLNINLKIRTKKCITKRVKMKIFVSAGMLTIRDGIGFADEPNKEKGRGNMIINSMAEPQGTLHGEGNSGTVKVQINKAVRDKVFVTSNIEIIRNNILMSRGRMQISVEEIALNRDGEWMTTAGSTPLFSEQKGERITENFPPYQYPQLAELKKQRKEMEGMEVADDPTIVDAGLQEQLRKLK